MGINLLQTEYILIKIDNSLRDTCFHCAIKAKVGLVGYKEACPPSYGPKSMIVWLYVK